MTSSNKIGPLTRARYRVWGNIKMACAKFFRRQAVRSAYGPKFVLNIHDLTFRKYIRSGYGFFFANHLSGQGQPFVFIDIGANQGLYSILAAENPNCLQIFAFEPASRAYELLVQNIKCNGSGEKTVACNVAISHDSGDHYLYVADGHSGAASLSPRPNQPRAEKIQTVDSRSLDQRIKRTGVRAIVKIDVEGHEEVVLDQLIKTEFWADVQQLFIEVDERWLNAVGLINKLSAQGFELAKKITGNTKEHYDLLLVRAGSGAGKL